MFYNKYKKLFFLLITNKSYFVKFIKFIIFKHRYINLTFIVI